MCVSVLIKKLEKIVFQDGKAKCLYGITSYASIVPYKCNPEHGAIYTRVSAYTDWIEEKIIVEKFA